MASSGLIALHSIALLLQGETPPDADHGWGAMRAMERDLDSGLQQHLKLSGPQPRVEKTLKMAGFDRFLEIFDDQAAAIASF